MADFADHIHGAGGDDEAVGRSDGSSLGEGGSDVGSGVGGDVEGVGGGEELFDAGGAGVVDGGEDDVVVRAVGTGVEEGEEDLGHLPEVLVAETAEEEGARLALWKMRDGGTESPGSGGVVGYVEQQAGTLFELDEFEAARPSCVANSLFNVGVCDFVTITVTYWLVGIGGVS